MKAIALCDDFDGRQWRAAKIIKCRTSMSADISQLLVVAYKGNHGRPNLAYYARMQEPHAPFSLVNQLSLT